jgi:glutamate--cysteine ligase
VSSLEEKLRALSPDDVKGMRRGVEKESLRVQPDGRLALTPHPRALGSALTHPNITTDFSESQLELITDPYPTPEECLEDLTRIHQAVYRAIGEEILWCASMPCGLPADDKLPLGQYGASNIGRAKTVYRNGLAYRYGRRMQMISGIHYNWSLPGLGNDEYFALLRNFRRNGWLLFYLFGASPAACTSFVEARDHRLQTLKAGTLYLPHATTLRMGRLGYQSDAQASIVASFNSLEAYGAALEKALLESYPPYEAIGVRGTEGDGKGYLVHGYRQLATSLIQIENEFYGKIRPKRRIRSGERPLHALRERGVEYVEVRLMDLDPFEPVGISARTMRLLDLFLLHCLLSASPPDTPEEIAAIARNQECVAGRGREPGLKLIRGRESIELRDWGSRILEECRPIAAALEAVFRDGKYPQALAEAGERLHDPEATPSARVLAEMARAHGNSYTAFALEQSQRHARALRDRALAPEAQMRFARMATESLELQARIESQDRHDFETWRREYLSRARLHP